MTTKQVNKIAIGENLFYDVIEEHIPFIIEKKAEAINNFFREMLSYIEEKAKKSDWFFMNIRGCLRKVKRHFQGYSDRILLKTFLRVVYSRII